MIFKNSINGFYTLEIKGIPFWKKDVNDDGEVVYEKISISNSFTLYLDRFRNMKGVPDSCFECLDLVTGRLCALQDLGDKYMILPSRIVISKDSFVKNDNSDILSKAVEIVHNKSMELEYTNLSEGILFDSYFCDVISKRENIDIVPLKMFINENETVKKRYKTKNLGVKNDK